MPCLSGSACGLAPCTPLHCENYASSWILQSGLCPLCFDYSDGLNSNASDSLFSPSKCWGICLFGCTLLLDVHSAAVRDFYSRFHCAIHGIVRLKWLETIILLVDAVLSTSVCSSHLFLLHWLHLYSEWMHMCLLLWHNLFKIIMLFICRISKLTWCFFVCATFIWYRFCRMRLSASQASFKCK
jgi:hypothetical protein